MEQLNKLLEFLGSANAQKAIGLGWAAVAAVTDASGHTNTAHISGMTLGAAYAAFIHAIDAWRAKIGR